MPSITFPKAVHWAGLESLPARFWPPGLVFHTPALEAPSGLCPSNYFSLPWRKRFFLSAFQNCRWKWCFNLSLFPGSQQVDNFNTPLTFTPLGTRTRGCAFLRSRRICYTYTAWAHTAQRKDALESWWNMHRAEQTHQPNAYNESFLSLTVCSLWFHALRWQVKGSASQSGPAGFARTR